MLTSAILCTSLWLYGDGDPFYDLAHSRANFAAFRAAGGQGAIHEFPPPPGRDGHRINTDPAIWASAVEAYLQRQGLSTGRN